MKTYLFDTYAFLEIIKGNKDYEKFIEADFRTTIFNLYELYYNLLKEFDEIIAKSYFNKYFPFVIEIRKEHIFYASEFRMKNTKKNLSYVDALGYAISILDNYQFLTGDKEFNNLENVEFVK